MKPHPIHWGVRAAILVAALYALHIQPDCSSVSPLASICEVQP